MKHDLPAPLIEEDTKWPQWTSRWSEKKQDAEHIDHQFNLYYVESRGWVIATLHISNAARGSTAARTYAIQIDNGQICRVGLGPHVKEVVRIYIRRRRVAACQKIIDLFKIGETQANQIRDRISTRRAQGALRKFGF